MTPRPYALLLALVLTATSPAAAGLLTITHEAQPDVMLTIYNGNFGLVKDVRETRLLSTRGPVFKINGQIHLGSHGRLVLPALPDNLVARPTLVWLLRNRATGPQRMEASCLTGGLTWKTDYVLVLDAADRRADLTGRVTSENRSGATYANAALKLVVGDGVYKADASGSQQFVGEDWIDHTPRDVRAHRARPRLRRRERAHAEGVPQARLRPVRGRVGDAVCLCPGRASPA